jgi:hypothetical protein
MRDLLLDIDTHDLEIDNYDLAIVDGADRVKQHLKIRLLFFFNEWYLDGTQGIRYYDFVAVKNPDMAIIDGIIKATIAETPDVLEILEYQSEYDVSLRSLTVTFTANTTYGIIELETGVP